MSGPKKDFENYLALFAIMIGGVLAIPALNLLIGFLPAPIGSQQLFNSVGFFVAAFVLVLIYLTREVLWDWHTGNLSFKSRLGEIDVEIYRLSAKNQISNKVQIDQLSAEYRNLLRLMRSRNNSGGMLRAQFLVTGLFIVGIIGMVAYWAWFSSLATLVLLTAYAASFAGLTGAFAVGAVVVLESSSYRKRFRVIR